MENNTNTIDIIKQAIGAVVGIGVTVLCSTFAGGVADSSTNNRLQRMLIKLGGVVIGGMVANEASKFVSNEIDEVVETVNTAKELADNIRREAEKDGDNRA